MKKFLTSAMILLSSTCFAHNANQEAWDDEVLKSILANENSCVQCYDDEKIYLNPDKIHPTSQGIYLNLNDDEFIFIPSLNSDIQGCYVECGINARPKVTNTCPGCGREYLYGGCGNSDCPEFQRQKNNTENHKRDQQQKKDDYKRSKKEHKKK